MNKRDFIAFIGFGMAFIVNVTVFMDIVYLTMKGDNWSNYYMGDTKMKSIIETITKTYEFYADAYNKVWGNGSN